MKIASIFVIVGLDPTIQTFFFIHSAWADWIPAFAGMTAIGWLTIFVAMTAKNRLSYYNALLIFIPLFR